MATADRMSAYSVIVCPLRNSLARTYSFVMNSISPPSETSPCGEVLPFFRFVLGLELAVDRAEQRVDGSAHGLVANEHHDGDRRQDERVLGHRLSLAELIGPYVQLRDELHFSSF